MYDVDNRFSVDVLYLVEEIFSLFLFLWEFLSWPSVEFYQMPFSINWYDHVIFPLSPVNMMNSIDWFEIVFYLGINFTWSWCVILFIYLLICWILFANILRIFASIIIRNIFTISDWFWYQDNNSFTKWIVKP